MDSNGSAPSLFPQLTIPPVSDEEFKLFHQMDRKLYTRLVQTLNRNPIESMQVMAFWMWLEKDGNEKNLVQKVMSLPPVLLTELTEETVACLKCVENDYFQAVDQSNDISLLPGLLSDSVSLRTFHEKRIGVLHGVAKIMDGVCARAFMDITEQAYSPVHVPNVGEGHAVDVPFVPGGRGVGESSRANDNQGFEENVVAPVFFNPFAAPLPSYFPIPPPPHGGMGIVRPMMLSMIRPQAPVMGIPVPMVGKFRSYSHEELGEILERNLTVTGSMEKDDNQVPPHDRTIFLTFSKGYPISEYEVREFFTRSFGDFIEDLIMQEVPAGEQALYARMVSRSTGIINTIIEGSKAKYSINGKHVWARKYVKKTQQ